MFQKQANFKKTPIRKIVAVGDSITYGLSASSEKNRWVNLAVSMLEEYQEQKIELLNQGICSNILSMDTPAFHNSSKPCGLERIQKDVIDHNPDMIFIAYGLNDARGGTSPRIFRRDYQTVIHQIRSQISPIIVLLNLYYMHEDFYKSCEGWNESDLEITEEFNLIIRQLAEKNHLILADVYSAQKGVDWAVCDDHCHPNDLGHRLIANKVFESIMRNCSLK